MTDSFPALIRKAEYSDLFSAVFLLLNGCWHRLVLDEPNFEDELVLLITPAMLSQLLE